MSAPSAIARRLLTLSNLHGVGPMTLGQIAEQPDFMAASIDDLGVLAPKLRKALAEPTAWPVAQGKADRDLEQAARHKARILCPMDAAYPALLRSAKNSPFFLYVRGSLPTDQTKSIAVVGTREPTEHGKKTCERLSTFFASNGWSIVSGLALGIDAVAHSSALAAHGHTVAVLAHGLHTIAPTQHEYLAHQILDSGGALVSEFPFGMDPYIHQFVKRDRTLAGLANGVVMVQSAREGGSLHASRAALQHGRHLVVPLPTERDRNAHEPKIEANMLLANCDDGAKTELLKCAQEDLSRLTILTGRNDYPYLIERICGYESTETRPSRERQC